MYDRSLLTAWNAGVARARMEYDRTRAAELPPLPDYGAKCKKGLHRLDGSNVRWEFQKGRAPARRCVACLQDRLRKGKTDATTG